MHEHDVAEVDVALPRLKGLLAHPGKADHHLKLGAVAVLQGGETQFPGVAGEHHPPGDPDEGAGLGARRQIGVRGPDLGQGVRARHGHRVGLVPLCQQALSLCLADPELFGKVSLAHVASA